MIQLWTLGTLRVEGPSAAVADDLVAQPKALGLLCYLALARPRGFHQRDRIVAMFWPELDQERARAALRKLLHRLRQTLGEDVVQSIGRESVALIPDLVRSDAADFDDAVVNGRLTRALELYCGELLPSFFIPGADEFERWLENERAYYHQRAVDAAWSLVESFAQQNEATNATRLARLVARLASRDERMTRRVLKMLDRLGDRAGAMDVYRGFERRLRRDLDVDPSPETVQLIQEIQTRNTV
jgi:DNA-binding SARP family transcriptional activator